MVIACIACGTEDKDVELNWLLQTIKDAENAERFVLAQDESGRISFQMMVDVSRERGGLDHTANQFSTIGTRQWANYNPAIIAESILNTSNYFSVRPRR